MCQWGALIVWWLETSPNGQSDLPESTHQEECQCKIWHYGLCVSLQFMIQSTWCKSSHTNMLEHTTVFGYTDDPQKFIFPSIASVSVHQNETKAFVILYIRTIHNIESEKKRLICSNESPCLT